MLAKSGQTGQRFSGTSKRLTQAMRRQTLFFYLKLTYRQSLSFSFG